MRPLPNSPGTYTRLITRPVRSVVRDSASIQRGIIRHVYLVIDLSSAMLVRDYKATWLDLTLQYAQEFVTEFFDQNPIGQMAIMVTRDGLAERLTPLSGPFRIRSLVSAHTRGAWPDAVHRLPCRQSGGPPENPPEQEASRSARPTEPAERPPTRQDRSLVRSRFAARLLELETHSGLPPRRHLPPHGSREVIIVLGSLTTCDPTNIHQTISDVERDR